MRRHNIPTDKLAIMHGQLIKSLKAEGLEPEKREQYEYKKDAIEVIMAARAGETPK